MLQPLHRQQLVRKLPRYSFRILSPSIFCSRNLFPVSLFKFRCTYESEREHRIPSVGADPSFYSGKIAENCIWTNVQTVTSPLIVFGSSYSVGVAFQLKCYETRRDDIIFSACCHRMWATQQTLFVFVLHLTRFVVLSLCKQLQWKTHMDGSICFAKFINNYISSPKKNYAFKMSTRLSIPRAESTRRIYTKPLRAYGEPNAHDPLTNAAAKKW